MSSNDREGRMIKSAIIGCGMIADQHVSQIQRVPDCEVVATCDQEPLMARQLADRFHIPRFFANVQEMLKSTRPQVVHVTTPAQSHYSLGKLCLESGCHVYVEKPFTINAEQAEELIDLAVSKGLKLTVGHNLQFNPEAIRMRALVKSGFLGGPPIHIECTQCFTHDEPTYGKTLLGDRSHWVRSLPGSLLHNLISHGIAKIVEYLPEGRPTVLAHLFTSPFLAQLGQTDLVDELRSIIRSGTNTTAYFTFSTQCRAASNQILLYGPKASVMADSTNRILVPHQPTSFKSYLRYFLVPLVIARSFRRNSWQNIRQFLKMDFHMDYSMKMLIQSFYRSIQEDGPVPIPYRELLTTAWIMDDIFAQIHRPA